MPAQGAAHRLEFLAHQSDLVQDAASVLEQQFAGFGQADAAPVAQQKRLAQFNLQLAHVAAQQRLRQAQGQRGTREAAHFSDPDE